MSNLNTFAELIRKGKEEKKIQEQREAIRKQKELAPLLGDLFKSVATAKKIEEKRAAVIDKVDKLEANAITSDDVEDLVTERIDELSTETEKKLLVMVKRLQDDITTLKRHVDTRTSQTVISGGGGGEVRVLRMDDVDNSNLGDGKYLTYSASLNKLIWTTPSTSGTPVEPEEEMPYAKRIDFISDNEFYKGEASVGSTETALLWRIKKVVISIDGDISETWANGSAEFNKQWSDRLIYNYF